MNKKYPLRVCITEVIRQAGNKKRLDGKLSKLPQTKQVLDDNLESLEDFMIRKTIWTSDRFIKEKIIPTKNKLTTRACVRNSTLDNSILVQTAIDESLIGIKKL